jgi:hypothetical protein
VVRAQNADDVAVVVETGKFAVVGEMKMHNQGGVTTTGKLRLAPDVMPVEGDEG